MAELAMLETAVVDLLQMFLPFATDARRRGIERVSRLSVESGPLCPRAEAQPMLRHWIKLMLLALLVFLQMACPKYAMKQTEDVRAHPADDHGGSESGAG
jgi:hypothetical protein